MENLNLPPFYPGQKVVSLIDVSSVNLKKGDILTVVECIKSKCSCGGGWIVALKEYPYDAEQGICDDCGSITLHLGISFATLRVVYLAPLEEKFEHISLSKVIEIETCLVSEN